MFLRALVLGWSLCCWGALAVNGSSAERFSLRLVGGDGRCRGELQVKGLWRGLGWTSVFALLVPQWFGHRLCTELDCGPALTLREKQVPKRASVHLSHGECDGSSLTPCFGSETYQLGHGLELNCSDSVRLVSGKTLCSGSLQIRDQSSDRSWTSVCEGALGRRGAEVLCRELGCGPPLLQGELSPLGQTFHCEGHESALMDCPRNQTRTDPGTCSTLNLTCSEPVRLVEGPSRCEGALEVRHRGEWRRVTIDGPWDLEAAAAVCRVLDCGSAVSAAHRRDLNESEVWALRPLSDCEKNFPLTDCVISGFSAPLGLEVVCSDSVRLVSGRSLCSGSVQIRDQSLDRSWTSVCEGALDRRGAEVLCRELGCGVPLLQGELSPLGQTFHCEGNESSLMDCPRNQTRTNPGTCPALNLTCSEPLRLVGGASRCEGTVELKYRGEWREVMNPYYPWNPEAAGAVCRDLDCGSVVSKTDFQGSNGREAWGVRADCVKKAAVRDCVFDRSSYRVYGLRVTCSGHQGSP